MRISMSIIFLCFLSIILRSPASADTQPVVFVSIAPQEQFVQQISGDLLSVEVLVPAGASPHTYEPKPSQMKSLAEAKAYFAIGVDFETVWLKRIGGVNPAMKIIHTDAGIDKLAMTDHHHAKGHQEQNDRHHDDGHQGHDHAQHHNGEGLDPHIWLAPSLVKQQAVNIADALADLFPEHASTFQRNRDAFIGQIETLDRDLRTTLADRQGMQFLVFHPSWGYFAREYGLQQVAVEVDGKNPKPAQLAALIEHAREHEIRVVFTQPQLSTKGAELIAREIDGEVILIDPLAEDWLSNLREVARRLKGALQGP
ncbi:zinc transport system substrate-binding protein [Desulfofustis glycolicus DSM 9705]|uniref:Zinc transport system substrate-binding protein n=2 Tax=Desulfofustis glycolicus TaxID=51195 RepID=A0A1M5RZQ8_9BACT|nr:zinc transport system substrate-binding protein [Desulfofustis glycolicus DSM 9705]